MTTVVDLFDDENNDLGAVHVTSGPIAGMTEVKLLLEGTSWSVVEMRSDNGAGGDYTLVTLIK